MARVNNLRGTYVEILMSTALGPPEVFTVLCGINAKSLTQQVNTADAFNRDCALPEDIPVRELISSGVQWDLRGSGQMNRDQFKIIQAAVGLTKNFRFYLRAKVGETLIANPTALQGHLSGPAKITTLTVNGNDGEYAGLDIAIASDGAWVWTDVALT